jgi:hypothetical protein
MTTWEGWMKDSEIQLMVEQIDTLVPKDDAKLIIYTEDDEPEDCEIIGNRDGYLRAAAEFLRAAIVPLEPNAFITPVEFNYLVPSRGLPVKRLSRSSDVEAILPPLHKRTWKDKVLGVGCITIFILLAVCTFVGIGTIGGWIFGK